MSTCVLGAFIVLICITSADETIQLREPDDEGKVVRQFPDPDNANFGSQNKPDAAKTGIFGSSDELDASNTGFFGSSDELDSSNTGIFGSADKPDDPKGNFGSGNGPGASGSKRFGRQGLKAAELMKSDAPAFESSDRKEVRKFLTDTWSQFLEWTPEERMVGMAQWRTDSYTCTFVGDPEIYDEDYCDTIYHYLDPTQDFVIEFTIGKISVSGTTAIANVKVHATGKFPFTGMEYNRIGNTEVVLEKKKGQWFYSRYNMGDDSDYGLIEEVKLGALKHLRNSVYSAKQNYPDYNPVVIVAATVVTSLLAVVIFSVWIIRKRLPTRK